MSPYEYTTGPTLVNVDKVNLTLDGKVILRDVSVTIEDIERPDQVQGQVICFLGPSGIGKTRLSRIMAGLDAPTTGKVEVLSHAKLANGQPIKKLVKVEKGMVGMVPQNYPLFDFLTVRQNLLVAEKQGNIKVDALSEFIKTFDLQQHLDKYPIQLSGGTRQRVAIVRQLLCSEHFIIMDEPFSGLDPIMKQRTCDVITRIAALDSLNTIIVVTHDVTEGMAVADKVWLMGRNANQGASIREVIDFAAMGIAWRPDIYANREFLNEVTRVKTIFKELL